MPSCACGLSVCRKARFSGAITSLVHCAARLAPRANSRRGISPVTARSWLPARHTAVCSRASSTHTSGSAPYPTRSPRHHSSAASLAATASSVASNACRLPWMSEMTATFIACGGAAAGALLVLWAGLRTAILGQGLDSLARTPLGIVVLHRVDQLAHEAGREVHARDHHARHLLGLHLVIDARKGDGELVVGVADVGEVGVY